MTATNNEFQHAINEALGKGEASLFRFIPLPEREMAALAYSHERKAAFLLLLAGRDFEGLSADQYLDEAKSLNHTFGWFCVPAQRVGPHVLWGGKTMGPIYAYKFNILNESDGSGAA